MGHSKKNMYNFRLFSHAYKLLTINPYQSNLLYQKYINLDPKNFWARNNYIMSLITIGKFVEAEKELNEMIYKLNNEKEYVAKYVKRIDLLERGILINKLRLLSYTERYEELYELYRENYSIIEQMNINGLVFYCKRKLNIIDSEKRDINGYTFRQMIRYEDTEFFEHITRHMADYNKDEDIPNPCIFTSDFPLETIVKEIKKYMTSENGIYPGFYEKVYVFKYSESGLVKNKMTDYFKVICLNNTDQIITMYPVNIDTSLPYIDLNYLRKEEITQRKRLSQVEKFNQRYKR